MFRVRVGYVDGSTDIQGFFGRTFQKKKASSFDTGIEEALQKLLNRDRSNKRLF